MPRQNRQHSPGFVDHAVELAARDGPLDANDQIEALNHRARVTQHNAKHPAHAVAIDGARQRLGSDHEPDAPARASRRNRDKLKEFTVAAPARTKNLLEGADAGEPAAATCAGHRREPIANQGASRVRPFARRAERTLRPPTLFMRARKPCVRLRLTTEGWNVRFMMVSLDVKKPYIRARYS